MAEKFGFEKRFRQRGAVDRHKRPLLDRALVVDGAGDEFLARPGFAPDQNARRRRRDLADLAENLAHEARIADHFRRFTQVFQGGAKFEVLLFKRRDLGLVLPPFVNHLGDDICNCLEKPSSFSRISSVASVDPVDRQCADHRSPTLMGTQRNARLLPDDARCAPRFY